MRHPDARLLIFAKSPVPGQVKTRLIPALGAQGTAALAERLLERTLTELAGAALAPLELWCAPDCHHPTITRLCARLDVVCHAQCAGDLGARLQAAAADALCRATRVLLVGADIPALDAAYCATALDALDSHEAVLGPAEDGGYVLLGIKRAAPDLFRDMPWGDDRVGAITQARIEALGWRCAILPTLWDLDRPEDLARLGERLSPGA